MNIHPTTLLLIDSEGIALDPSLLTTPNVLRAARSMRRQYKAWEDGIDYSPSSSDLLVGIAQALDVRFPHDALDLATDELFEASCSGATLPQLAFLALTWANRA